MYHQVRASSSCSAPPDLLLVSDRENNIPLRTPLVNIISAHGNNVNGKSNAAQDVSSSLQHDNMKAEQQQNGTKDTTTTSKHLKISNSNSKNHHHHHHHSSKAGVVDNQQTTPEDVTDGHAQQTQQRHHHSHHHSKEEQHIRLEVSCYNISFKKL